MGEWINGWMGGWMGEWKGEWIDGEYLNSWMIYVDEWMGEWIGSKFDITRFRSWHEADRFVCGDLMCMTFLSGNIIVKKLFAHDILMATFLQQRFVHDIFN